MVAAGAVVAAGTIAVLFALPFSNDVERQVSNDAFLVNISLTSIAVIAAIRSTSGPVRKAWACILLSFGLVALLFAADPQPDGGARLSFAFDAGALPAFAYAAVVLTMCRPVFPALVQFRTLADAAWFVVVAVVIGWVEFVEPVVVARDLPTWESALHLCFLGAGLFFGVIAMATVPYTRGSGQGVLALLGVGGLIGSIAGMLHIRFFYDDSLRFGSPADYLWTLSLATLTIAGLTAGPHRLEFRARGARWHAAMTVIPLGLAIPALAGATADTARPLAVALLVALALRVVALLFDNERLTDRLSADAEHDPLTGLENRRTLEDALRRVGDRAGRSGHRRAVIGIDLDHFKRVNDQHGHLIGDQALQLVANRLRQSVRADATIVRYGGDEFIVAMEIDEVTDASQAGARIRDALEGTYVVTGATVQLGATVGVAVDRGECAPLTLLAAADRIMYEAKAIERGSVRVAVLDI